VGSAYAKKSAATANSRRVAEIAEIGEISDRVYADVTLFLGYRFGADFLLVGANGKGSLRVTCKLAIVFAHREMGDSTNHQSFARFGPKR